jgi:signal transduction histidine kinase
MDAVQALADTTHQQAGRLNRLVNDLLDTSRIQAGRMTLHPTRADLGVIVRSAVEEQRQAAPERHILLHLPSCGSLLILADAERIGQVVTNYLTNALKYSDEERPVVVGVQREGEQGLVWVRDQGPGIPESEQERVWERFHRVPGIEIQSGSGIGLGIGLHISKTIIEQHGGQVGVHSSPGQGATFWFTLSLASTNQRSQQGDG